jgi:hypothetical protein
MKHLLVRPGQVVQERARLDRLVGDRVLLARARRGLEDVVDAVVDRIEAGEEARPAGPARPLTPKSKQLVKPPRGRSHDIVEAVRETGWTRRLA